MVMPSDAYIWEYLDETFPKPPSSVYQPLFVRIKPDEERTLIVVR